MDELERHLLNYDDLSAEERADADRYLERRPDAAALLREGRALRALFAEAARLHADVPDSETIAQYLAAQHFAQRPLPDDLRALGERIEAAFAEHPDVERQYSIMRDRLRALTAEAESPSAQFERLTGRAAALDEADLAPAEPPRPRPVEPAPPRRDRSKGWRSSVAADRSPLRLVSLPRLALAAAVLGVLLYGGLLLASQASTTSYARLADLGAVENEFAGLRLRGTDGEMDPAADRYAEALDALEEAHAATLGLFPDYDPDGLARTVRLLNEVIEEEPGSALALEAWFLIGRVFLHEGNLDAAREAFTIVVEQEGPSAPDAQRLLDEIGNG